MINIENQSGVCKWTKTKKSNFGTTKSSGEFFDEASLLQLGVYFYFGHDNIEQDVDKAIKIWRICDELYDSGEACFFLGKAYSNNDDEMFYETTMKYYQKALDKGVEEAYFPLGYMYFNGYGVEKDVDKALELFESSVKCKDKDGLYFLGFLYATGFKVKKDVKRAKRLFRESAELGNEAAKEYLASLEE